jgi:NADPH:quinone reductase
MKAAVYERTGPADEVLEVKEIETPKPGPGEVRVELEVSGVNPTDWKSRSGATARPIEAFQIPNHDGAGVIDEVGEGVDPGRVGERVWVLFAAGGRPWGTAAEWTVVPSAQAVRLPAHASFDLGASLGVPAVTAHRCLFADGPVTGKTVLVAGGAGAVGHFAIELGKWGGATVLTTVSGDEKAELARQAGADLVINYKEEDAAERVKAFCGHVDRIVEVAFNQNIDLDLAVSRPETAIVVYAADGPDPVLPIRRFMTANVTLEFVLLYGIGEAAVQQATSDIDEALEAHALTELPVIRFPLEQIAAAHDAVEQRAVGKVLVDV